MERLGTFQITWKTSRAVSGLMLGHGVGCWERKRSRAEPGPSRSGPFSRFRFEPIGAALFKRPIADFMQYPM